MNRAVQEATIQIAENAAKHARAIVPVDKGELRDDIRVQSVKRTAKGVEVDWGSANVSHALFVEIGSSFNYGSFYLQRSLNAWYPLLPKAIWSIFSGSYV